MFGITIFDSGNKLEIMRWVGRQGSGNVSDRRGMGGKLALGGGIGGVIVLLISLLLGNNPLENMNVATQNQPPSAEEDEKAQFVSVVLKDTEDVWHKIFSDAGGVYSGSVITPNAFIVFMIWRTSYIFSRNN